MCATASSGLICAGAAGAAMTAFLGAFGLVARLGAEAFFAVFTTVVGAELGATLRTTFLAGDFLTAPRAADFGDAVLRTADFFTAFFATLLVVVFLPGAFFTAFFATLRGAFFTDFLLAAAFFTGFLAAAAGFLTAFFLVELARLDAFRAADFFAADLRVVAMRGYSSGFR